MRTSRNPLFSLIISFVFIFSTFVPLAAAAESLSPRQSAKAVQLRAQIAASPYNAEPIVLPWLTNLVQQLLNAAGGVVSGLLDPVVSQLANISAQVNAALSEIFNELTDAIGAQGMALIMGLASQIGQKKSLEELAQAIPGLLGYADYKSAFTETLGDLAAQHGAGFVQDLVGAESLQDASLILMQTGMTFVNADMAGQLQNFLDLHEGEIGANAAAKELLNSLAGDQIQELSGHLTSLGLNEGFAEDLTGILNSDNPQEKIENLVGEYTDLITEADEKIDTLDEQISELEAIMNVNDEDTPEEVVDAQEEELNRLKEELGAEERKRDDADIYLGQLGSLQGIADTHGGAALDDAVETLIGSTENSKAIIEEAVSLAEGKYDEMQTILDGITNGTITPAEVLGKMQELADYIGLQTENTISETVNVLSESLGNSANLGAAFGQGIDAGMAAIDQALASLSAISGVLQALLGETGAQIASLITSIADLKAQVDQALALYRQLMDEVKELKDLIKEIKQLLSTLKNSGEYAANFKEIIAQFVEFINNYDDIKKAIESIEQMKDLFEQFNDLEQMYSSLSTALESGQQIADLLDGFGAFFARTGASEISPMERKLKRLRCRRPGKSASKQVKARFKACRIAKRFPHRAQLYMSPQVLGYVGQLNSYRERLRVINNRVDTLLQ